MYPLKFSNPKGKSKKAPHKFSTQKKCSNPRKGDVQNDWRTHQLRPSKVFQRKGEKLNKLHKNLATTSYKSDVQNNLKDAADVSFEIFQCKGKKGKTDSVSILVTKSLLRRTLYRTLLPKICPYLNYSLGYGMQLITTACYGVLL